MVYFSSIPPNGKMASLSVKSPKIVKKSYSRQNTVIFSLGCMKKITRKEKLNEQTNHQTMGKITFLEKKISFFSIRRRLRRK